MAYTALEKMRQRNLAAYGKDVGPAQPSLFGGGLERKRIRSPGSGERRRRYCSQ